MKLKTLMLTAVMAALLASPFAEACSRVFWNDNGVAMVAARTLDWSHSFDDVLMVFPRGQKMNGGFKDSPTWTSK